MPSRTYPYAVFGFSENIDWSTLHFVKPIDDIRVCSACRVVARKAAFLPCRHVLCEPCYEQWKPRVKVCFLDGDQCPENEVYWREFPVDRMMKCKVRCWNEENGCEAITDVSSIAEHFHRDCTYHSTCCPKCSSTVLRKNIVAHLDSHCVSHVLSRKCTGSPIEGVSTELVEFRKGLRSIELALRSPTHTNTSVPSTLQSTHACHVENLNPLVTMAAEVKQVSLLTKQALSLAKENCEWSVNQAAFLKTAEASLSAEFDKIAKTAGKWSSSEISANREQAQLEEQLENLQLLRREIEVVFSRLAELRDEAAIVQSAAESGLTEARVSSKATSSDKCINSHRLTVRVFEDALKVPVKALCSVDRLPRSIRTDKECMRWCHHVEIDVDDNRYGIRLLLYRRKRNTLFNIEVYVVEQMSAVLAKSPRKVKLTFMDGRKHQLEYESDERGKEMGNTRVRRIRRYLVWSFHIDNPEECLRIDRDQLRMCLTFSY